MERGGQKVNSSLLFHPRPNPTATPLSFHTLIMQGSHHTATYETASARTHLHVLYFDKMLLKKQKGEF